MKTDIEHVSMKWLVYLHATLKVLFEKVRLFLGKIWCVST